MIGGQRFVPERTTSPDWICWTLYVGEGIVVASTLTPADATEEQAWRKLGDEQVRAAAFRKYVQSQAVVE